VENKKHKNMLVTNLKGEVNQKVHTVFFKTALTICNRIMELVYQFFV
jgi:hypothetical protein